ncbi:MAG: hypothetical protein AB8B73_13660 [Ekhidna sp.]
MKTLYSLIFIPLIISSCEDASTYQFKKVDCIENDQPYRVFKPCRQYIYNAKFWDAEFNLISENQIWMMATGKPWDGQPELQGELIIQYEYDSTQIAIINTHNINNQLNNRNWTRMEVTGIIENENNVWMHPFRSNQFNFTEVATFPEVRTPLHVGKKWSTTLSIHEGWGDWTNSTLNNFYEVQSYEAIDLSYGELDAWHINSYTEASFGSSSHHFWFHPEFGFVKMVIHNYAGQTLQIELMDVIEN